MYIRASQLNNRDLMLMIIPAFLILIIYIAMNTILILKKENMFVFAHS